MIPNLNTLTEHILAWGEARNLIKGATPRDQFVKVVEELGELAAGLARNDDAKISDSIGDLYVTLVLLAAQKDMDITACIANAYLEIKDRKGRMIDGIFVKEEDLS
jgi:NTP pyrophosphatase (non-canonical NTP hydrolase)